MSNLRAPVIEAIAPGASKSVEDAVDSRRTVRRFSDYVVPRERLEEILSKALRAPSGGNVQPWRMYVLGPKKRDELVEKVTEKLSQTLMQGKKLPEKSQYDIYPAGMEKEGHPLNDVYMPRRREMAFGMFEVMGIERKDKMARAMAMAQNFEFFGAPVGIIFTVHEAQGPPQWSDIGMYMQTVMLLAREAGLHTCPQEAWAEFPHTIKEVCGIPKEEIVFAGLGIGKPDLEAPVNQLKTYRAPLNDVATFLYPNSKL